MLGQQLGDLRGRHLLLIDDILDSGGTIKLVQSVLGPMEPASVKTCVLLRKQRPAAMEVPVDYVGFEIPDEFVVGYGLDYDNYYRNLPDIVSLRKDILERRVPRAGVLADPCSSGEQYTQVSEYRDPWHPGVA